MNADDNEFRSLQRVTPEELNAFEKLDQETQRQIIQTLVDVASNQKVPEADREIARRQAAVYRKHKGKK